MSARGVKYCPALHVLGVLLEQPFVGIAFHVGRETGPLLFIYQINDQAAELGRILDFVLGFTENRAEHARPFAQFFEGMTVMNFKFVAIQLDQQFPSRNLSGLNSVY